MVWRHIFSPTLASAKFYLGVAEEVETDDILTLHKPQEVRVELLSSTGGRRAIGLRWLAKGIHCTLRAQC